MAELGIGISGSLIASIIYNAAKEIYRGFNDSFTKALEDTSIYFAKEENIEFGVDKLRNILQGKVSASEIEKLRSGNDFIDGDELAVQFATFGELYFADQSKILPAARSILDYFTKRFEHHLLVDPKTSSSVLAGYIKIYGEKSSAQHNHIITILHAILERLESYKELPNHARELVPPIEFAILSHRCELSDHVRFTLINYSPILPVPVYVEAEIYLGGKNLGFPTADPDRGYYSGRTPWNMNPLRGCTGHFGLPEEVINSTDEEVSIIAKIRIVDQFGREHELLPIRWNYNRKRKRWIVGP